jgi:hypothetical protein
LNPNPIHTGFTRLSTQLRERRPPGVRNVFQLRPASKSAAKKTFFSVPL